MVRCIMKQQQQLNIEDQRPKTEEDEQPEAGDGGGAPLIIELQMLGGDGASDSFRPRFPGRRKTF